MKYTVLWHRSAEAELANLWTTSADRTLVAKAADEIDERLAIDPWSQGEARSGSRRLMFHSVLAVLFEVDDPGRRVSVLKVARSQRR